MRTARVMMTKPLFRTTGRACVLGTVAALLLSTSIPVAYVQRADAAVWERSMISAHVAVKLTEAKVKVVHGRLRLSGACYTCSLAAKEKGKWSVRIASKCRYLDKNWKRISRKAFFSKLRKSKWLYVHTMKMCSLAYEMMLR